MLESYEHQESCFVTLTYSEENCPLNGLVSKRDAQLFLKRLRERVEPARIRYYLVGEYGDVSGRPHYHAILFGLNPSDHVMSKCKCCICGAWTQGFVYIGEVSIRSVAYVAGYVVKDLSPGGITISVNEESSESCGTKRAKIRRVPFGIMSRRPGIGAGVVPRIVKSLKTTPGGGSDGSWLRVRTIRINGTVYPVSRYIVGLLGQAFSVGGVVASAWPLVRLSISRERQVASMLLGVKGYLQKVHGGRIQSVRDARTRLGIQRSKEVL